MADYSEFFPKRGAETPDYSEFFPKRAQAEQPVKESPQPAQPQGMSLADRAKRVLGLGARSVGPIGTGAALGATIGSVVPGVGTALGAGAGATAAGVAQLADAALGTNALPSLMDRLGLPRPANAIERVATDVTGAMANTAGQLGLLRGLAQPAAPLAPTVSENVLGALTQQPGRQLAATATGIGAGSTVREMGGSPTEQFVAQTAGSFFPFASQLRPMSPEVRQRGQVFAEGRDAGFVASPSDVRPNLFNRYATGMVSGRPAMEQAATVRNQGVTNNLVKRDLGISPNERISINKLNEIRSTAGQVYKEVSDFGIFNADRQFTQDLARIAGPQQRLAAEAPSLGSPRIEQVVQDLSKPTFSGQTVTEMVKALRENATKAFKAGETGEGRFFRQAADAVEGMVERNFAAAGKPDIAKRWNDARTMIAKTYTAEAALNDTTGNVSARLLGSQLDKGAPISGQMRKAARFQQAFPGSMADAESATARQGASGVSMFDLYAGLGGAGGIGAGVTTGNPAFYGLAALPFIRPATRAGMLSGPYQNMIAPILNPLPPGEAGALALMQQFYNSPK